MSWFKKLKKGIKQAGKSAFNDVVKPAAEAGYNAAKKVEQKAEKIGGGLLNRVDDTLKNGPFGLFKSSNMLLYAGVAIAAIVVLPRILDSQAAKTAADKL
jgi:hypothetical protein